MSRPAARQSDPVTGTDVHIVLVPSAGGPVPTPLPHPFSGTLVGNLSSDVFIDGLPAATMGSTATNNPPHLPTAPGTAFQKPPMNRGTVQVGSTTVLINSRQAARVGDTVMTCGDPVDAPTGTISAGSSTVMIG